MKAKDVYEVFPKRLRAVIAYKKISIAEIMRRIGVSNVSVSKYMNGKMLPNAFTICALADALETTPDVLFGYKPLELD